VASIVEQARDRVRATGSRVTAARTKVLAVLLQADGEAGGALTHTDVQRRLEAGGSPELLDRVTLYRVLEWLVDAGLAHRVSGPDRVWRFSAHPVSHPMHGHFKCRHCERMFCLKESPALGRTVRALLPEGFAGDDVELTVLGVCAECAGAGRSAPRRVALSDG
jgi:Fur family ferric uptake transcriptional regulator